MCFSYALFQESIQRIQQRSQCLMMILAIPVAHPVNTLLVFFCLLLSWMLNLNCASTPLLLPFTANDPLIACLCLGGPGLTPHFIADAASRAAPAVVNITVHHKRMEMQEFFGRRDKYAAAHHFNNGLLNLCHSPLFSDILKK